jgi:hypothetical protein
VQRCFFVRVRVCIAPGFSTPCLVDHVSCSTGKTPRRSERIFFVVLCVSFCAEKRKNLEEELKVAVTDRDKNKMTNHHFEQELRRVQSIIDCMIQLNPHQVKHIQKIQPDFRFKVREGSAAI